MRRAGCQMAASLELFECSIIGHSISLAVFAKCAVGGYGRRAGGPLPRGVSRALPLSQSRGKLASGRAAICIDGCR